jgi:deoxyribodipyrimidine photolyase-related protein
MKPKHLVIVLGDQFDGQSAAFDGFDPAQDAILQMEVREEATYVQQHKRRLIFFFAAMRHFREEQRVLGRHVYYSELDEPGNRGNFADEIRRWATALQPQRLIALEPGDWRVRHQLSALELPVEFRSDRHFLCSSETFEAFAQEHPRLMLEQFYRIMRRRLSILIEPDWS